MYRAHDGDATEHPPLHQRHPAPQPHRAGGSDRHTSPSLQGNLSPEPHEKLSLAWRRSRPWHKRLASTRRKQPSESQALNPNDSMLQAAPWQPPCRKRPDHKAKCRGSRNQCSPAWLMDTHGCEEDVRRSSNLDGSLKLQFLGCQKLPAGA